MIGLRILQGSQNLFHIFQQKEMHENALLKCKKMSWCQSVSKSKKQEKCYLLTASAKVLKGKMTFTKCSARTIFVVRSLKTISLLFTKTLQKYWKTNDKPSYSKNIFKTSYSVHIFGNIVLQTLFESKIFSCLIFRSSRWKGRTTPRDSFLTKYLTQKWRRSSATFRHERSFSTRGMTWYLTLLLEIQNTLRT